MDLLIGDPGAKYPSNQLKYDDEGEPYVRLIDIPWRAVKMSRSYYAHTTSLSIHSLLIPEAEMVDHKYGNGLDNRPESIRSCNRRQNGLNRDLLANNTSGYIGVGWRKNDECWKFTCSHNGQQVIKIGFATAEEAARARDTYLDITYRGTPDFDFIRFNFPEEHR